MPLWQAIMGRVAPDVICRSYRSANRRAGWNCRWRARRARKRALLRWCRQCSGTSTHRLWFHTVF